MIDMEKQQNLSLTLSNGRNIGYAEYGDPEGTPVLYFHGFPGSRLEAAHLHQVAIKNNVRLLSIDRPGMGLSSIDKHRSVLSWASDIELFVNMLEIDMFSVLGHSGGAPFVAAIAYKMPKRLIAAAIISGMAPVDNPQTKAGMSKGQRIFTSAIQLLPWLSIIMMKFTYLMLRYFPSLMNQMIKQLPQADQQIFKDVKTKSAMINATLESFRNGTTGPANEMLLVLSPWGFNLKDIFFPISIWHGLQDTQVPIMNAIVFTTRLSNSQSMFFKEEGHHSVIRGHGEEILKALCYK